MMAGESSNDGETCGMWNYAICNETFGTLDWTTTCQIIAEAGYDGVEIAPFTLNADVRAITPHDRRNYAEIAHRSGLAITGLHWLLVSPAGLSLTASDDTVRATTADYLASLVDFCADLGGKTLVLGSPAQRRIPPNTTAQTALLRLEQGLELALNRAARQDVLLCLEPLPAPEADLIMTLQEAVNVIERLQHPNLRTILDIKSASSETDPIPDLVKRFAPHLAHVHVNDVNRRGPGFGDTDFVPILTALNEIEYSGYLSVEVFDYTPDPTTIANSSLVYLRRCFQINHSGEN